ncbi:hypothetical protein HF576_01950 [Microbacterium sp. CFH 90308]|uniref:Uncharacterized protein n=1 Tax=Microbacterium salsuginis TaxID=2722803 RepID=A0ABX1K6I8_9MICO|nr:hypothetical protein [Microbacterium sp. CFH 90308]NLP82602.1 hypothetical protein [Microbacterium sp. CFH 90308]
MSDGLSASRMSLESERKKAIADVTQLDTDIATADAQRQLLQERRAFLQAKIAQLTEGIDALRTAEQSSQV